MSDTPWLTIIGLGEDAPENLPPASRKALEAAEIVIGPPRHLGLLPTLSAKMIEWPVPFADGIAQLLALRGQRVVMLASGDPFWFGAGTSVTRQLDAQEWVAYPAPSTFALAASEMGWALETTACFGLHAAPLERLRPALQDGARVIVLLRDGAAVEALASFLVLAGWAESELTVLQALGGPRAQRAVFQALGVPDVEFKHPLCVALKVRGDKSHALPLANGRADQWFDSDGTMTKRPVRALTLSALAPRAGEHLWDIGGGSGSIAIEWLLSGATLSATCIEPRETRVETIRANAAKLGVDRLKIVSGSAPDVLSDLDSPDVVFIGGGLSQALLTWLTAHLSTGTRIVANAVTLESEQLLTTAQMRLGGELMRIDIAHAEPLGPKTGWKASFPIVQWSVTL
ncbi:MAG: precorrin-6Y C5,15-methyltransferase (decarboxylating) subunit CbiT [Arenibacterium sp.]